MPIPGPRSQFGPDPGYRNPENAAPTLFNQWNRPDPVMWAGRSPGLMTVTLRGCVLGAGQIRRLWRQSVNYVAAQPLISWTENGAQFNPPTDPIGITRALRYMTRSVYVAGGTDHTRFDEFHTVVKKQNYYKQITVGRGQSRMRPTVRNRMTSFGSRVPTLNKAVAGAATDDGSGG